MASSDSRPRAAGSRERGEMDESSMQDSSKRNPLILLGFDLTDLSSGMQQAILGVLAFVAIGAAALAQEYAINELNFKHTVVFTATIPFATAAFGAAFGGLSERKAPLGLHFLCGLLGYATFELSNLSPIYNNYPTHTMCKSAKILPTMALGVLVLGKSYSSLEYWAAGLLIAGLAVFLQADAAVTPNFEPAGIGIIGMALVCDALMSNVQESMFKTHGCSQNEMAAWTMGTAFVCTTAVGLTLGTYVDGFGEALSSVPVALSVLAFAVGNYLTTLVILTMIGRFGAASTVFTTSVCKAGSMALSFILMPKEASIWHLLGVVLVGAGVYLNLRARKQQRSDEAVAADGVKDESKGDIGDGKGSPRALKGGGEAELTQSPPRRFILDASAGIDAIGRIGQAEAEEAKLIDGPGSGPQEASGGMNGRMADRLDHPSRRVARSGDHADPQDPDAGLRGTSRAAPGDRSSGGRDEGTTEELTPTRVLGTSRRVSSPIDARGYRAESPRNIVQ